jgi:hypothetical protein
MMKEEGKEERGRRQGLFIATVTAVFSGTDLTAALRPLGWWRPQNLRKDQTAAGTRGQAQSGKIKR